MSIMSGIVKNKNSKILSYYIEFLIYLTYFTIRLSEVQYN